ncbi:MAG: N-acetylmuramoyl-L-alanine amidase [Proteobacteria bacterium]|nr:N-acetylmuramoyl-L-alanine amidase [Pseudomonadota bacterium]
MPRLIFLIFFLFCGKALATEVQGVHANRTPSGSRLVFDVVGPLQYTVSRLDNPPRLIIDFKGAKARRLLSLDSQSSGIKHIRQFMQSDLGLRVEMELAQPAEVKAELLPPLNGAGQRLAVELTSAQRRTASAPAQPRTPARAPAANPAPAPAEPTKRASAAVTADRDADKTAPTAPRVRPEAAAIPAARARAQRELVVAVDAGHGGQDVGAIGPSGTYEKDIVLAVARELVRLINRQPGMRAVMTRDGDYFLPLRTRMDRARAKRADLFISVHADAVQDRRVQGSSVYVLSQRGASSEAAKWLAANENAADLVGGVSLDDKDRMLKTVLLDLSQAASLDASIDLGNSVLRGLRSVGRVHHARVQSAGFMVLKSPDIPSILVETAFISNPVEEKRLRSETYRQKLARAIFNGVVSFNATRSRPVARPVERVMADAGGNDARRHRVSPGETLSTIADRYDVSINTLKQANDMDSEMVRAGSTLRIP